MLEREQQKKPEVWVHIANFLPWSAFVDNQTLKRWVEKSKGDKMEWIALAPLCGEVPIFNKLGPTAQVLAKPVDALQVIFGEKLGGGHVVFNSYSSLKAVALRREDPLRPGKKPKVKIAGFNILMANERFSTLALKKLEQATNNHFPVDVYPSYNTRLSKENYSFPYAQTHPEVFKDTRSADGLINAVNNGEYAGIVVDLDHFQESTSSGLTPFGSNYKELLQTLEKFYKAGVLKEVHVRVDKNRLKDLRGIFRGSYSTQYGRMLKYLMNELGFMGPYTTELDPRSLIDLYGRQILFPSNMDKMFEAQSIFCDYIRQAKR